MWVKVLMKLETTWAQIQIQTRIWTQTWTKTQTQTWTQTRTQTRTRTQTLTQTWTRVAPYSTKISLKPIIIFCHLYLHPFKKKENKDLPHSSSSDRHLEALKSTHPSVNEVSYGADSFYAVFRFCPKNLHYTILQY